MNIQIIIVTIIIATAIFYIARTVYKNIKGNSCESGDCKCETKPLKKVS